MAQKITLKEIAQQLGVAESTVSRAMNNKPGVSQNLKEKILALAHKMGYRPNALAQGLALDKSRNIGILIPHLDSSFYRRVFQGIEMVANGRKYRIILGSTSSDEQKEEYYMNLFHSMQADGIMVLGEDLVSREVIRLALGQRPLLLINCYLEEFSVPSLLLDHQAGAYKAIAEFFKRGYGKILLINGLKDDFLSQEMYGGLCSAYHDRKGVEPWAINVSPTREGGYKAMVSLLEKGEIPEALLTINEMVAIGAIDALQRGGFYVPEDLPVVAYGDSIIAQVSSPTLTTVKEPAFAMGQKAMEMMLCLIEERGNRSIMEIMEGEMVFRGSFPPTNKKQEVSIYGKGIIREDNERLWGACSGKRG